MSSNDTEADVTSIVAVPLSDTLGLLALPESISGAKSTTNAPFVQLLSPAQNLPYDVLSHILVISSPESCWRPFESGHHQTAPVRLPLSKPPWTLSHVSHSWREAALLTPSLWTHLAFGCVKPMGPLFLLQEALRRSHPRGLDLSIGWLNEAAWNQKTSQILKTLLSHSQRWQKVRIMLPRVALSLLHTQVPFDSLKSLGLRVTPFHSTARLNVLHLKQVPCLSSLTLNRLNRTTLTALQLPWDQITSLGIISGSIDIFPDILQRFQRLTSLTLHLDLGPPDGDMYPFIIPDLKSLVINSSSVLRLFEMTKSITSLRELRCPSFRVEDLPSFRKFGSFFSSSLQRLELVLMGLYRWRPDDVVDYSHDLLSLLETCESLKDLTLSFIDYRFGIADDTILHQLRDFLSRNSILPQLGRLSLTLRFQKDRDVVISSLNGHFVDMMEARWIPQITAPGLKACRLHFINADDLARVEPETKTMHHFLFPNLMTEDYIRMRRLQSEGLDIQISWADIGWGKSSLIPPLLAFVGRDSLIIQPSHRIPIIIPIYERLTRHPFPPSTSRKSTLKGMITH